MNVLITSASRKVGLVRSFQRALEKEGGGCVIAVDSNPYSAALVAADRGYVIPEDRDPAFWDVLCSVIRNEYIDLVVPTRDEELLLFARERARFPERVTVAVPDVEAVRICQDKALFADFCRANGFGTPTVYQVSDLSRSDFPVYVRARWGKGGSKATVVHDPSELELLLASWGDVIIQEFVRAPEFTVDLIADFSGTVLSVVPRERLSLFGGESVAGRVVDAKAIIDASTALATRLGLVAHNTIQCFWDGAEVKFIEVNPRYGGGATISILAGADSPRMLIRAAKGQPVPSELRQFRDGLVVLRYLEDIVVDPSSLPNSVVQYAGRPI